ncbi:phosphoribosylanthranilate isomerase [Simiduia litorea]|uniref:phosphoribosylanthranilate isomerase n=1 Tax=Simiduia litorea TaxID=1435348 RepID=UPI0036F38943
MVQQRTRVKVCGLTSVDNALAVEACGVDAIGLVFYPPSPRSVHIDTAANIAAALGPLTHKVGLFVNADAVSVEQVLARVDLSVLQFHGDEPDSYCRQFRRPFFKALRMQDGLDIATVMAAYPSASGFLLDAYKKGVPGGTGESFDWARVPKSCAHHLLLAGGLTPSNVGAAIEQTGVYGVDVSGGVESGPGVKNIDLVRALIAQVQRVDQNK